MKPTILHLDIDAFFASVEQLRNPRLRGRPVIVGTGCIASCSYEARRSGLSAGMPIRQALRLCPDAAVLEGDHHTYACFTDAMWEIARDHLPAIETFLDEAYGDLTGTGGIYAHPLDAGRLLRERIRREVGLPVTVGIAANRMIAKMAGKARKPDGLAFIPWGEEEAFVAPRPVRDLPGVGPVTGAMLEETGIRTIADLRAVPLETMAALLGRTGAVLYDRCRGRDTRPIHEREIPVTISRETSLTAPTSDPREIRAYLQYLVERAMTTARKMGLLAGAARVRIRYADGEGGESGGLLPVPTAVDEEVLAAADRALAKLWTRRVNLSKVGVVLSKFQPEAASPSLFAPPEGVARLDRLHRAVDAVRERYGHASIAAGASIRLLGRLRQDAQGYVLRTPSLTK